MDSINNILIMNDLTILSIEKIRLDLQMLLDRGRISIDLLSRITKIKPSWFEKYLQHDNDITSLSTNDFLFLTDLISILSIDNIDHESRLTAILETMTQVYQMDEKLIATCAGIDEKVIINFLHDPHSVSLSEKYEMAIKVMFVYYILKFPNYEKSILSGE